MPSRSCLTTPGHVRLVRQQEVQEPSPSSWYPAPVSVNLTGFCSPQWIHHKRGHAKGCGRQQNLLPNLSRLPRPSGLPSVKRSRSQLWRSLGGMVSFWAFLIFFLLLQNSKVPGSNSVVAPLPSAPRHVVHWPQTINYSRHLEPIS